MVEMKEYLKLLISEMKRHDTNHRDLVSKLDKIHDEQIDQGKTLVRNTESLIIHEKRTTASEKRLEQVENHIIRVGVLMDLLTPTKKKITVLMIIASLLTGGADLSSKNPVLIKVFKELTK